MSTNAGVHGGRENANRMKTRKKNKWAKKKPVTNFSVSWPRTGYCHDGDKRKKHIARLLCGLVLKTGPSFCHEKVSFLLLRKRYITQQ